MRQIKWSKIILWAVLLYVVYFLGSCVYLSQVERTYPAIREVYSACREKIEEFHPLMLSHVESNKLELTWYTIFSSKISWQEDALVLLDELDDNCKSLTGDSANHTISFGKTDDENWYVRIRVGGIYGRQVHLYYYPYDELPFSYCERLDGLGEGWSFTAVLNY